MLTCVLVRACEVVISRGDVLRRAQRLFLNWLCRQRRHSDAGGNKDCVSMHVTCIQCEGLCAAGALASTQSVRVCGLFARAQSDVLMVWRRRFQCVHPQRLASASTASASIAAVDHKVRGSVLWQRRVVPRGGAAGR